MIYSDEINKVCAVCQNANKQDDTLVCKIKKQTVAPNGEACKKFKYDILKRPVRRMRKLKTDFDPKDFAI